MTVLQRTGTALGLACFTAFQLLPPIDPVTPLGMSRLGLLGLAVAWWTMAPVPFAVTTVAALAGGVLVGALTLNEAFASPSYWVMWFAIGTFGLSAALESSGFNRRFALAFLGSRIARGRPDSFLMMFLLSASLMSGVMSNTVVAVVWLSLATTLFTALDLKRGSGFAEVTTIGIAWAANIGGIATPVGTANNPAALALITAGTGRTIGFLSWSLVGLATSLVLMATVFLSIRWLMRPDLSDVLRPETRALVDRERARLGPMTTAEKWALGWGGLAVLLWLVPDLAAVVAPPEAARLASTRLNLAVPALLVPVAMCLIPVGGPGGRPVLTWDVWARNVEWGMVIFIGGVLVIGGAVGAPETGIPMALERVFAPLLGGLPELAFVFVLALGVTLVTGVISNLVSISIFVPLGVTLSQALGVGSPVAVGLTLGMGAGLAYLLPSGTTSNAIVAGSGWLRVGQMLRYGAFLGVLHALVLAGFTYPLAKWLFS